MLFGPGLRRSGHKAPIGTCHHTRSCLCGDRVSEHRICSILMPVEDYLAQQSNPNTKLRFWENALVKEGLDGERPSR